MVRFHEPADFRAFLGKRMKQFAAEVPVNRGGKLVCILGRTQETCLSLYDVLPEGAHVGGNDWNAVPVTQKQHTALENVAVRQHEDVGRHEVPLGLLVRDVPDVESDTTL